MSSSRVIFVGAISIILGFYVLGLRSADANHQSIAFAHLYQLQANQIALSGIDYAVNEMGKSRKSFERTNIPYFEGFLDVRIDTSGFPATQASVVTIGRYKTHEARLTAIVQTPSSQVRKKKWNRWEIQSVYPEIRKEEFEAIYTNLKRYSNAQ